MGVLQAIAPALSPLGALILLAPTAVIGLWVMASDLKFMRIPNQAVLAQAAVWPVLGWLALPLDLWLWGFALMSIVLVVGFLLTVLAGIGAGDSKYAAAAAGLFAGGDLRLILGLFTACLLAAFVAHRIARALPAFRRAAPDWASWTHAKFPMGLALVACVLFYLVSPILASISAQ